MAQHCFVIHYDAAMADCVGWYRILGRCGHSGSFGQRTKSQQLCWWKHSSVSDVWNASSGVVVPYTEIYVLYFYYSFIVHFRGTISCFHTVVTCMAGDALAFSCGMIECERCAELGVVAWTKKYKFWLQHSVAFRQASLFVFIALRTHEPLLTGSNISPPQPIRSVVHFQASDFKQSDAEDFLDEVCI